MSKRRNPPLSSGSKSRRNVRIAVSIADRMSSSRSARMRRVLWSMRRPSFEMRKMSSIANIRRITNSYPAYPRTEAMRTARPYGRYGIPANQPPPPLLARTSYTSSTRSRLGVPSPFVVLRLAFHRIDVRVNEDRSPLDNTGCQELTSPTENESELPLDPFQTARRDRQ